MNRRTPFTPQHAAEGLLTFSLLNAFMLTTGHQRAVLVVNLLIAGFVLVAMIGTRFWPHTLRIREPGA